MGEGTRTPDIQIHSLNEQSHKVQAQKELRETVSEPLAHSLAREVEKDSNLALVIERWESLPDAVRAGIVAIVKAASAG